MNAATLPEFAIDSKTLLEMGMTAFIFLTVAGMDTRFSHASGTIWNALRRSLPEALGTLAVLAMTLIMCCRKDLPEAPDEVHARIRAYWNLLKDPDTLTAISLALRSVLFLAAAWRSRQAKGICLPPVYVHFLLVGQTVRCLYLHRHETFALEGPFAGATSLAIDIVALVAISGVALAQWNHPGGRLRVYPMLAVLLVCGYLGWAHRLLMTKDSFPNSVHSFLAFVEFAGMCHYLAFWVALWREVPAAAQDSDGAVLLVLAEQACATWYVLDGFGLLATSTLETVGVQSPAPEEYVASGDPVVMLTGAHVVSTVFALLAACAFFVRRNLQPLKVLETHPLAMREQQWQTQERGEQGQHRQTRTQASTLGAAMLF